MGLCHCCHAGESTQNVRTRDMEVAVTKESFHPTTPDTFPSDVGQAVENQDGEASAEQLSEEMSAQSPVTAPAGPDARDGQSPHAQKLEHSRITLDEDVQARMDELLRTHKVFEAHDLCPEYVEARSCLDDLRMTAQHVCGDSKLPSTRCGDGEAKWQLSHGWGGPTLGSPGKAFVWWKLALDMDIPWWKSFGSWQEPDLDVKVNPTLVDAFFVGDVTVSHGIRCNIGGFAGRILGYNQEYYEVFRYLNPETGFCVECNRTVDHADLEERGFDVGKEKYKKGADTLMYVISYPRAENKSTAVFFSRTKPNVPTWVVNIVFSKVMPTLLKNIVPGILQKLNSDPDFLARYDEDQFGVYADLRSFNEKALAAMRGTSYDAQNMPTVDAVLGRFRAPCVHDP